MPRRKGPPLYLKRQHRRWYYRRRVPDDVRAAIGQAEWVIALGTESERDARHLAAPIAYEHDRLIRDLRRKGDVAVLRKRLDDALAANTGWPTPQKTASIALAKDALINAAEARLRKMSPALQHRIREAGGLAALFKEAAQESVALRYLEAGQDTGPSELEEDDESALDTYHAEQAADASLIDRRRARLAPKVRDLEQIGVISRAEAKASPKPKRPDSISAVSAAWLASRKQRPNTARRWSAFIRRFIDLHGDVPIGSVTKAQVKEYREAVSKLPDTRILPPNKRAASLPALLDWADQHPGFRKISASTATAHLNAIKAMLRWASRQDVTTENVARDVDSPVDDRPFTARKGRRPFKREELQAVHDAVVRAWDNRDNRDRYWLFMLALYHGLRLEEGAQLGRDNILTVEGAPIVRVDDADGRRVKNQSSIRDIPLHPAVIELGFMDFVRKATGPRLFTSFEKSTTGNYGTSASKAFSRLLDDAGVKDRRTSFHSLRHNFIDAARNARMSREIRDRLTGHARPGVSEEYGEGHELKMLREWISKVRPLG